MKFTSGPGWKYPAMIAGLPWLHRF
jgi:hypothetical protein